jgi:transposase
MASRGRKRTEIAQDLRVHRSTVILWFKRYHKRGLAGLHIQWAPGKTRRIPQKLAPTIQAWVIKGPQRCGLDRANWTYEELATHLDQQTGIDVKRSAMQDFCQHHPIRPYRPTYRDLRGDPHKQQTARQEIEALKKSPARPVRAAQSR